MGAGWLGAPLAQQLQTLGLKVVVTARSEARILSLQAQGLPAWRLDMEDAGEAMGLTDRLQPFNTLVWAVPPGKASTVAYADQLQQLLAHWPAQAGRQLIFYSSTSVYPENEGSWNETRPILDTHRVAEAEKVAQSWGEDVLMLRCGGLCDENRVIGRYFSGKPLTNARQAVNYVHKADVIAATLHLMNQQQKGIFNVVAPLHPDRQAVFTEQAKRYLFEPPLSYDLLGAQRLIAVDKLLATGYRFKHPDPQLF